MSHDLVLFGEALVDQFASGAVVGGAPLNVARHLAGLGLKPLLITRLGRDAAGQDILREFERYGLSKAGVQLDPEHPSGAVRVAQSATGEHRFEILPHRAYDYIDASAALKAVQGSRRLPLYFGSLCSRGTVSRRALTALRAASSAPSYLDLNWREALLDVAHARSLVEAADTIKFNDVELRMVLDWYGLAQPLMPQPPSLHSQLPQFASLLRQGQARLLIVTYGAAGYAAFGRDGRCLATGTASAVEQLVDTVGAGDAFSAIVLLGLCRDWPLALSLARASEFAAAVCGLRGAAPAELDFYQPWCQRWGIGLVALEPPSAQARYG